MGPGDQGPTVRRDRHLVDVGHVSKAAGPESADGLGRERKALAVGPRPDGQGQEQGDGPGHRRDSAGTLIARQPGRGARQGAAARGLRVQVRISRPPIDTRTGRDGTVSLNYQSLAAGPAAAGGLEQLPEPRR